MSVAELLSQVILAQSNLVYLVTLYNFFVMTVGAQEDSKKTQYSFESL